MADLLSILVFGAGAIGTYVGGSLALAGHRITFIEQPKAVEELHQRGLRLELINAKKEKQKAVLSSFACVSTLTDALKNGPYDFAIFALKSFDTATAVEGMKPFVEQMPPFLCLQNGVDNETELAAVLGAEKVIPGVVTSSVGRRGIGNIVLERLRGVGLTEGHPLSLFVWKAMESAALNPRLYLRPKDMKWSKMLTNLPANASAAILDMTAAEVFDHPRLFGLEMQMLREALAVMRAQGIRVVDLPGTPTHLLALGIQLPGFISRPLLRKAVGGGRGGKMPSFHIDLHSERGKSEVEWLNGAVVRYGKERGIPTPVNRILTETLSALTRGEIALTEYSCQPEKLLEKCKTE